MKPGLVLRPGRLRGFPYGIVLEAALCSGLVFAAMTATVIFSPCIFLYSKILSSKQAQWSALIAVCSSTRSVSIHSDRLEGDVTGMLAEVTGVLGAAGIRIKACAVSLTAFMQLLKK